MEPLLQGGPSLVIDNNVVVEALGTMVFLYFSASG